MDRLTLIIPVKNEESTIEKLIDCINKQTLQPSAVILVDGGSADNTIPLIRKLIAGNPQFSLIEAGNAMPGKGRNIGAEKAETEWIAFTDAGTGLDPKWLELLQQKAIASPGADIVYGNYSPYINSFFEKCAAFTYVPPLRSGKIRAKSIVSCLLKKKVWKETGGFPDWRAAEDLNFIEKAEKQEFNTVYEPRAIVHWFLQPGFTSTYRKFRLYSTHNVWAGMQAKWHYGIARQYLLVLLLVTAAVFHHPLWLLGIPLWLIARAMKRIFSHREEFGVINLFNPAVIFMVILITLTIDTATFSGWIKAASTKKIVKTPSGISRPTNEAG